MNIKDKLMLMRKSASENERRIKEWSAKNELKCRDCRHSQCDIRHCSRCRTKTGKDFQKD